MASAASGPAPVYREHDLFRAAALPVLAGIYDLEGGTEIHGHDFCEIAVVGGGTGRHVCAQGEEEVRRGAVFVLRPGAWHGFVACDHLVVANTCVSMSALRTDLGFLRDDPGVRDLLWTGPLATGSHGVLRRRISATDADDTIAEIDLLRQRLAAPPTSPPAHRIVLLGQLLGVLGRIAGGVAGMDAGADGDPSARAAGTVHPAVAAACAHLDTEPEHPWQVADLARLVSLDPTYLTRLFRRHVGLSPIAYLSRLRAENAAGMLARTTLPVARVGALVGWPDPTYFARRFRSLVGLTPTAYRRHLSLSTDTHEAPRVVGGFPGAKRSHSSE
ncbi:AraC family transcriptional regulator [Actinopolymorpha sp. B17G11]|uniref:AraC family transcriptional regulator n=1 Tax=unclassified Actinopolymorpha TaxID=2627063 RepID=UPI0032D91C8C